MRRSRPLHRLTQACDHCRTRKIKCDLRRPSCANCENRSFVCRFSAQQRKRGPRLPSSSHNGGNNRAGDAQRPQVILSSPDHGCTRGSSYHASASTSTSTSPVPSELARATQSPTVYAAAVSAIKPARDPALFGDFEETHAAYYTPPSPFASIYHDLEAAGGSLGLALSLSSLARRCVDHFFDCLYPIMPIVYRPKVELGLCLLQPGIERREVDIQVFTLTASLQVLSRLKTELGFMPCDGIGTVHFSFNCNPVFQSGYTHSVGKPRTSWDELEAAIALAQDMRLHDEASYAHMDEVESQLCRRLFWVLYTGDKSAGILGKHHITLGRYLLEDGITVQYTKSLDGEDLIFPRDSTEPIPALITGFNFNQDLWRAAYLVLLEIDTLRERYLGLKSGEEQASKTPTAPELSHLGQLYVAFETSLGGLPAVAALLDFGIHLWHPASPHWPSFLPVGVSAYEESPDSYVPLAQVTHLDPDITHTASELHTRGIRIAEDMLYILHTSDLDNLRLNGESCVEKIRLVGASMLELIDHHADSPLANIARRFRDLYPHILAHLESKASDSLSGDV
ncbi:hypothetical protein B0J14DRAFT_564810 [Halenospora varia]|nr:hypothetical protein B0J14DRAFT_564810 [Halenospora varia]